MGKLEGKVAVVTGAGRGIGRAIAILFAREGAKVVVNDPGVGPDGVGHDRGPADQVVEEIRAAGGTAVANYETVADYEAAGRIIQAAVDNFGRIDILVNNAGILRDRMIFNMTEEEWDAVIAVHLKGTFNCTRHASVLMRQQRYGRIINVSSESGLWGNAGQANYGAAKAGIAGFTRVVARDLGRYGVTCNAVAPAALTRMTQGLAEMRAQRGLAPPPPPQQLVERTPEHVAPMVVFLASDEAWNVNGKIFHVAGGHISLAYEEMPVRQLTKDGMWTIEELAELVPQFLTYDIPNPAPPPPDLEIPGRPARPQG
jgi:NAD(P)-dependent dehydrogenase (short-subunit alcohol dehydrogenase family)